MSSLESAAFKGLKPSGQAKLANALSSGDQGRIERDSLTVSAPGLAGHVLTSLEMQNGKPVAIDPEQTPQLQLYAEFVTRCSRYYVAHCDYASFQEDREEKIQLQLRHAFASCAAFRFAQAGHSDVDVQVLAERADSMMAQLHDAWAEVLGGDDTALVRLFSKQGFPVLQAAAMSAAFVAGVNAMADSCEKVMLVDDDILEPSDFGGAASSPQVLKQEAVKASAAARKPGEVTPAANSDSTKGVHNREEGAGCGSSRSEQQRHPRSTHDGIKPAHSTLGNSPLKRVKLQGASARGFGLELAGFYAARHQGSAAGGPISFHDFATRVRSCHFEDRGGDSMDNAIVIHGATSNTVGVAAEYMYLWHLFGVEGTDWTRGPQVLARKDDRRYDRLIVELAGGGTREVFFDITGFIGK